MNDKTLKFSDVLTHDQRLLAVKLYIELRDTGRFAATAVDRIFTAETMARIDAHTGQQNDAKFMAYALEFALSQAGGKL